MQKDGAAEGMRNEFNPIANLQRFTAIPGQIQLLGAKASASPVGRAHHHRQSGCVDRRPSSPRHRPSFLMADEAFDLQSRVLGIDAKGGADGAVSIRRRGLSSGAAGPSIHRDCARPKSEQSRVNCRGDS